MLRNSSNTSSLKSLGSLAALFAGGNLIVVIFRLFGGVFTAKAVDPAVLGLFNGLMLVLGYAPFFQAGILNGLNRELPYFIGKGEKQKALGLAAAGQAWALLVGGVFLLGLLGFAAVQMILGNQHLAIGWATIGINAFLLFYGTLYLQITYRTHGDFARLAFINILTNGLALILVLVVWWLSFYGLCLRSILVGLGSLILLLYYCPIKVKPQWDLKNLKHLLKIGLPIFGVGQLYAWWAVLDSTLVLNYLGPRGLGFYSLALIVGPSVELLPDSLSQIIYPKMAETYGQKGRLIDLLQMIWKPSILLFFSMIPVILVGWQLVPHFTNVFLPKYADGIRAAQWSLITALIMCLSPMNNAFTVVKRLDLYLLIVIAAILTYFFTLMWLTRNEVYLAAFPQAMVMGKIVFLGLSYLALNYLKRREALR